MDITLQNVFDVADWSTFGINVGVNLATASVAFTLLHRVKLRCFVWIGCSALMQLFIGISAQTILRGLEPNSADYLLLWSISFALGSLAGAAFLYGLVKLAQDLSRLIPAQQIQAENGAPGAS